MWRNRAGWSLLQHAGNLINKTGHIEILNTVFLTIYYQNIHFDIEIWVDFRWCQVWMDWSLSAGHVSAWKGEKRLSSIQVNANARFIYNNNIQMQHSCSLALFIPETQGSLFSHVLSAPPGLLLSSVPHRGIIKKRPGVQILASQCLSCCVSALIKYSITLPAPLHVIERTRSMSK